MRMIILIATVLFSGSTLGEEQQHERHKHRFAPDVDAFHAALAPLWHAPAGRERSQDVCAQAQKLENLAGEIRSSDAKALLASISALKTQCQASPSEVDGAFSQVHDAFHHLVAPLKH